MAINAKKAVQSVLSRADIIINGDRPWDIQVKHPKFYSRLLAGGSLALGESYMDGWWSCKELDQFFDKILSKKLHKTPIGIRHFILPAIKARLFNMQTRSRSKKVAKIHYDLSNDFYEKMLDKRMQYTCAYYKNTKNLDKAQEAKLDLVCKKLKLKKSDKVLELGGGWGGFAKFAAEKYGCHVTSYNISKEQVRYARESCKDLPVEIKHEDYRNARGKYDKVASIGMMEHVGYKNYRSFIKLVSKRLKPNGLFLLHTIGGNRSKKSAEPWIIKYIFPQGMLPSAKQITKATEKLFVMEDWHNFGADYDKTLMAWFNNFNKNWDKLKSNYDERFYRMWKYYLLCCAGAFRARGQQLWQIVLSKGGVPGGYIPVR